MQTVTILVGLPGSGKTTWARSQMKQCPGRYKRVSKDDLRAMMDDGIYSQEDEPLIVEARNNLILLALREGKDVLVDDTNLSLKHRENIRSLVESLATVQVQALNVPLEECIERDRQRIRPVGEDVIRGMHATYIEEPEEECEYCRMRKSECICVD